MLKAIITKTIAAVRKVARFAAKAALRVLCGVQTAAAIVGALVVPRQVARGLHGALFALLIAASPLPSGVAHAHNVHAQECVETGSYSSGIARHWIGNNCSRTIKVGWCTYNPGSGECHRFWGLKVLGPGKRSSYVPTADTSRRFTIHTGGCYHEQYYPDVAIIHPRKSGSGYTCSHTHSGNNRSGGSSGYGGSQGSAGANSCKYANDGECDEPRVCARGTDTNDCGGGGGYGGSGGNNSCQYANDGECDEPSLCPRGTDSNDCR